MTRAIQSSLWIGVPRPMDRLHLTRSFATMMPAAAVAAAVAAVLALARRTMRGGTGEEQHAYCEEERGDVLDLPFHLLGCLSVLGFVWPRFMLGGWENCFTRKAADESAAISRRHLLT